jgi:hypothetical protein
MLNVHFMYRRPILCTLYDAVDFLNVLKNAVVGGGGGRVLLVHSEIYYVPVDDGWYVMYYITYQYFILETNSTVN